MGKTIEEAVHSAFDALQHELSHYRGKRRELDKQRLKTAKLGPRLSGKVVQLVTDQGYGFIDIGADEDVHFTRQVVMAGAFERLTEGMSVEVDVLEGSEGYEATRVVPLEGRGESLRKEPMVLLCCELYNPLCIDLVTSRGG